jgi:hypothetical protein
MNDAANGSYVDQTMKLLPAFSAQTPDPTCGGGNRQRNQQHERQEADGDEGALSDIFTHCGEIKGLVGSEVRKKMQADIKKGKKAEHAAETDEVGQIEKFAERCDCKRKDEKAQRPVAGGVLNELNGIRTEIAVKGSPTEHAKRHQTKQKNDDFGPFAGEKFVHVVIRAQ